MGMLNPEPRNDTYSLVTLTNHSQTIIEGLMKTKRIPLLVVVTALILMGSIMTETGGLFADAPPKEHRLHIRTVKNKWKVVDAQDSTKTIVTASKGENIVWTALGSDIYLQFSDSTLFGTHNATIPAGSNLSLTVTPSAKPGRYPYAAFCLRDKQFATGDSPPVIIIQ